MADELFFRKMMDIHTEFLRRLDRHDPPLKKTAPLILRHILECEEDVLELSLGSIGQKLRSFASKIDFSHPEIVSVFDGVLADDQTFAQECLELLQLAKFARDNQLSKILPLLGRVVAKESLSKIVIKKIDSPQHNRMHVRLLKDPLEREEIRLSKRMQTIDLQSIYNKGEEVWNAQPDSFSRFLRFDTSYQDDLTLAEKKVERYEELGCNSLADEVRKSIDIFREHIEQSHYGFNRITMTNAAVILAKSVGFNYVPSQEMICGFGTHRTEAKINVDRKFFGRYNFDPEQSLEFNHAISEIAHSPIFTTKQKNNYLYQPRVYPLHEFWEITSHEMRDIIALLESFPDAGNKPIFDHFGVIVPGVALPQQTPKDDLYTILDDNGLAQIFSSKEAAEKALDLILIKGEYIFPIVVGEKDGKCYFLSYFNAKDKK